MVVLLGATALGRAWLGVLLVIAFGIGMALTLTVAGLVVSHTQDRLERSAAITGRLAWLRRYLPVALACCIVALGTGLAARGLAGV